MSMDIRNIKSLPKSLSYERQARKTLPCLREATLKKRLGDSSAATALRSRSSKVKATCTIVLVNEIQNQSPAHLKRPSHVTNAPVLHELLESQRSYYAPLEVVSIPGKGRGAVASRDLLPGELLLASTPLAIVEAAPASAPRSVSTGHGGAVRPPEALLPDAADLSSLLRLSRMSPRQQRLVAALFDGQLPDLDLEDATGTAPPVSDPTLQEVAPAAPACLQLAGLSPDGAEGSLRGLLLPGGDLQVLLAPVGGSAQRRSSSRTGPPHHGCDHGADDGAGRATAQGAVHRAVHGSSQGSEGQGVPNTGASPGSVRSGTTDSAGVAGAQGRRQGAGVAVTAAEAAAGGLAYEASVVFNCYGEPHADELLDELLAYEQARDNYSRAIYGASLVSSGGSSTGGDGGTGGGGSSTDAASRGGGFVGLWPDFAMLNHSCCPNTINLVGGPQRHMLVRATEPIVAGEEVTVCYFGRELLAPRSVRVAATVRTHDFHCSCARCVHEASLGADVEAALQTLYDNVNERWGPRVAELSAEVEVAATALLNPPSTTGTAGIAAAGTSPGVGQGSAPAAASVGGWLVSALSSVLPGFWASGGPSGSGGGAAARARRARETLAAVERELRALDEQVAAAVGDVLERAGALQLTSPGSGSGDGSIAGGLDSPTSAKQQQIYWLRASMYDAYELRLAVAELLRDVAGHDGVDTALRMCHEIVTAVAPGTTLHIQLAARLAANSHQSGPAVRQATPSESPPPELAAALSARHGWLQPGQLHVMCKSVMKIQNL